jgi:hypothetical protein
MTLELGWLLNMEDFDVGHRAVGCVFTNVSREPTGQNLYQFEEDETRNFCPKTGGKRLFREIRVGMVDLKEIKAELMNWINVAQAEFSCRLL